MRPARALLNAVPAPLFAALLLALVNAVSIAEQIPESLRFVTRLRVHLLDGGLFFCLGWLGVVTAWTRARLTTSTRAPAWLLRTLFGMALGGTFGAGLLSADLANFVGQHDLTVSPALVGGLLGLVLCGALGALLGAIRGRWLQGGAMLGALALAYVNPWILGGDYPSVHLAITLLSFVVLSHTVARLVPRLPRLTRAAFAIAALFVAWTPIELVVAPRSVRQTVTVVSGSALPLYAMRWVPSGPSRRARPLAFAQPEWFTSRKGRADIAPAPRTVLPDNGAVLLLTVDALRADVLATHKHDAILPNLAKIRDRSLRFTVARSPSPSTLTTATALFSGKYYSQIYFTEDRPGKVLPLRDRSQRVPELLSRASVKTVHVRALHGIGRDSGVGRGFDEEPTTSRDYGRAAEVVDRIVEQFDDLTRHPERRLFLYTHFIDSHAPYTLGGKRATPFDSYLAELELVDRALGRLLEALERRQLAGRCLLVVSADHGEAFGEHGMRYHARSVYDELLRVPLYFHHPHVPPRDVATPVSLIDLPPTLLDLFRIATPGDFMGQSLVPFLYGEAPALTRPIAADSGRRKQALVFPDGVKVLRDLLRDTVEVYDITKDPKETRDLTDDPTFDVEPYVAATERFFESHTLEVPGWKPPWRSF
jgi:arylsulfatase A-like enzyme